MVAGSLRGAACSGATIFFAGGAAAFGGAGAEAFSAGWLLPGVDLAMVAE